MPYLLVFSSSCEYYFLGYIFAVLLVPFLAYLVHFYHKAKDKMTRLFALAVLVALFLLQLIISTEAWKMKETRDIIADKTYKTVEGKIENLSTMHRSGHGTESFNVKGVHFEFEYTGSEPGDSSLFYGYTKNLGGPIQRNGQKVKIHYIPDMIPKNAIVKMWIEDNK